MVVVRAWMTPSGDVCYSHSTGSFKETFKLNHPKSQRVFVNVLFCGRRFGPVNRMNSSMKSRIERQMQGKISEFITIYSVFITLEENPSAIGTWRRVDTFVCPSKIFVCHWVGIDSDLTPGTHAIFFLLSKFRTGPLRIIMNGYFAISTTGHSVNQVFNNFVCCFKGFLTVYWR